MGSAVVLKDITKYFSFKVSLVHSYAFEYIAVFGHEESIDRVVALSMMVAYYFILYPGL